ncbi:MAG: SAM-dependent methyltransferase [Planctomycetaceae bacterium]|nr:SAM-dependent methyltransferase [Planctomycetaceae bacterium]
MPAPDSADSSSAEAASVADFLARWGPSGGAERANYQLFLAELCDLLGVPRPEPTVPDEAANAYVFEKAVTFDNGDGTKSHGWIDLYRRGAFVCETKQGVQQQQQEEPLSERQQTARKQRKTGHGKRGAKTYDDTMLRARGQAEQYARHLPADEGRPPLLMVIDVGHTIELYAEFTQTGGVYTPFPDPSSYKIRLEQLADQQVRARLRSVWLEPLALDPARRSARVTRDIAAKLAELAKSLEASDHEPKQVAEFLMRCLFTMFAEDIGLLQPKNGFLELLRTIDDPQHFPPLMEQLWHTMNHGGFSVQLRTQVLRFNGGLFAETHALPLTRDQLDLLIEAAAQDWREVEPAIFGTLLERALDPVERHKLGAHYTPRAYVERLVIPTVVEPLRAEWDAVRAAAVTLAKAGDSDAASKEIDAFHERLCDVRVLDPACGSGNFLYVTLEHLKRLEGEVFAAYESIADRQTMLAWQQTAYDNARTVDPHQLLGIEINPRAAAIAELVLWIGYLQWHFRTRGKVAPPEPVIKNFHNIECRDAVLAWDTRELVTDDAGKPVTIWDGRTTKPHPVTGEEVPDETARVPMYRYVNPRKAEWPAAEFVVGNPPFVGNKRMRFALGDGYVEALRQAFNELSENIDYVMYWWDRAALGTEDGRLQQFGLITTNSLRQTSNRSILERFLAADNPLSLVFAVPDHPWVDSAQCAQVRISMTVAKRGTSVGSLLTVERESDTATDTPHILLSETLGRIQPSLRIGADLSAAAALQSNQGMSFMGVTLVGEFRLSEDEIKQREIDKARCTAVLKPYYNGRDLAQKSNDRMVIDFFGLPHDVARAEYPKLYQTVVERVKPLRDENKRATYREKWWIFGEPRTAMRQALKGLPRYIATLETSRHRYFIFLDKDVVPDHSLFAVALDDAFGLGVLSSRFHVTWSLAAGSRLGVGNDPRWRNLACFDPFPFPDPTDAQRSRIRELGEQLDAHRKRQQAAHPGLTMTGMYNVLEKLRAGESLSAKEKTIHEQGLVSVLRQIHDDLDAAVADAYGWPADLSDEEILERLVALNHERAEEERRGIIRWLRPEFQNPDGRTQQQIAGAEPAAKAAKQQPAAKRKKQPWPKTLAEQAAAVQGALAALAAPADAAAVAKHFSRANKDRVAELLETLASLGRARQTPDGRYQGA